MIRRFCLASLGSLVLLGFGQTVWSADGAPAKHPDAEHLGDLAQNPEFEAQGEYAGVAGDKKFGAQVIARGDGKYDVVLLTGGLPGAGWDGKEKTILKGETQDGKSVTIGKGVLVVKTPESVELKKVYRVSPTAGAKPADGAVVLFDGSNVDGWENGKLEEGKLLGVGGRTKAKFHNFILHLEFRTPFMPKATGQGRGNSGMYLLDQYECQILDSFGLSGENNECGGFYTIQKPNVNMCLPPMSWQTYDVDFTAAKYDAAGKKTANAVVTIKQNGVLIHDKFEINRNTPGGGLNDESQAGALFLQNHGDAVRFRNIWAVEKK
jgi:hypothetical protein